MKDASGMELSCGLKRSWRRTTRGGYGFAVGIPVVVIGFTARRVRVWVEADQREVLIDPRKFHERTSP